MKKVYVFVLGALIVACGKGAGPEPKNADKDEAPMDTGPSTDRSAALQPVESGRGMVFSFSFSNAKATVSMCTDNPFARIDQSWVTAGDGEGRRWGADKSRMIFDSANKVLTVINQSKNTFVKIDATRMAKALDDLATGTPMSLGNLGVASGNELPTSAIDGLLPISMPLPSKSPKKKHPQGCAVFERDLPQGLKEETCFLSFSEDLAVSEALAPLVSMANFAGDLEGRIREFETIAAVANAVEWDTGIPASQFKFGDSPFEEDNQAMSAWDRSFRLDEQRPCTLRPEDLEPPEGASEEFGLLPWNTPFIVTALPK